MNQWPRNDFLKFAKEAGALDETADAAWRQAVAVQKQGLPSILSLKHFAQHTQNSYQYLRAIVSRSTDPYRVFRTRKRRGGYRIICVPEPGLLRAQRWLNKFVLSNVPPHERSKAYATGSSILSCAHEHAGCQWLIKCDVQQFFESISEIQAYRVFRSLKYEPLVSFELARIVTRTVESNGRMRLKRWRLKPRPHRGIQAYDDYQIGHLPQGAPTSPKLSNLAMRAFDENIDSISREIDVVYTRYADDLIFSVHRADFNRIEAQALIGKVFEEMTKIGLRPHASKTVIAPPGARKTVLGLVVNDLTPRLSRDFRNRLKIHVHYIDRFGIVKHARNRKFDSAIGFRNHQGNRMIFRLVSCMV